MIRGVIIEGLSTAGKTTVFSAIKRLHSQIHNAEKTIIAISEHYAEIRLEEKCDDAARRPRGAADCTGRQHGNRIDEELGTGRHDDPEFARLRLRKRAAPRINLKELR
jgi:hypothetical protein